MPRPVDPKTELPTEPGDPVNEEIRAAELQQEDGSRLIRIHGQFWFEDWGGDEEK